MISHAKYTTSTTGGPVIKQLFTSLKYLSILISVYAAELAAGVLAYIYYETISEDLKEGLNETIINNYGQTNMEDVTYAIDHLQQDGGCIRTLEEFLQEHLLLLGAISVGIACFQLTGVTLSACFLVVLYREEKELYNAM